MSTTSFDPDALREKYREERDKRLRDAGLTTEGSTPDTARPDARWLRDHRAGVDRRGR